jgi:hypothetical protein
MKIKEAINKPLKELKEETEVIFEALGSNY